METLIKKINLLFVNFDRNPIKYEETITTEVITLRDNITDLLKIDSADIMIPINISIISSIFHRYMNLQNKLGILAKRSVSLFFQLML